ncbi:MAG: hypothetical protein M0P91_03560 [Sulfuricurvum sp.]|jgi:hypothetical protein|uniref:hypothetical protein n=1 Tax=Sulfuricurvum sp. TaxID=2025608 RepID=UPI0025DB0624|nr:hypothetical protein [Sulfuricurvum sp.]MCK9372247.1 hypothetical protein [Sulfuricurvum sp.]
MEKVFAIGAIALLLVFSGCSTKNDTFSDLKNELLSDKPVAVYNVPTSGIYVLDKWTEREALKEFPFIAPISPFDFHGKFHDDFYDNLQPSWKGVSLDKVDWTSLSKEPALYTIIYIQSVGITQGGAMVDDFMTNIAKAYNISPSKMEMLKHWIENGGILWSEAGLRASRFETFYPYGGINDAKTMALFSKDRGSIFGLPVRHRVLKSNSIDMVNYEPAVIGLRAASSASQLQGVKNVIFRSGSFIETYPIIQTNPLLIDNAGTLYAGYGTLGKGLIVTTVPTVYWQADNDGELYRWKLLSWVLQRQGDGRAKFLENPKPKL